MKMCDFFRREKIANDPDAETIEKFNVIHDPFKHENIRGKISKMEIESFPLYPTVLFKASIPEMLPHHAQIVDIVMKLAVSGNISISENKDSAHMGYQTPASLFERNEECFLRLKQVHLILLKRYLQTDPVYCNQYKEHQIPENETVCWAYIQNEKQISSYVHHHGSFGVSAVYYVQMPEKLQGFQGSISFCDPRGPGITSLIGTPLPSENSFHRPQEGMMFLFPSWLQHRPLPTTDSPGWRISLGIDTNFKFQLRIRDVIPGNPVQI
jgi:hypothetical protein